jgi:aldose 1-epimerase
MKRIALVCLLCAIACASPASAQYAARREGDILRLEDRASQTIVSIVPSVGNIAFSMTVKGHEILHWPFASVEEFRRKPAMSGIPFVGPWANRLDEQAFYANGTRYPFDMDLGNVRGAIPIHGFLTTTDRWQVMEVNADDASAWATSRLEVFRQPAWMKQWPFAHTIDLTYRLQSGVLEVNTSVTNASAEPMPIAIGFHPYFRLTDSRRDEWTLSIPARTHWKLSATKIPTGETEPTERLLDRPGAAPLRGVTLDDVFSDLVRDDSGRAIVSIAGASQRIDVVFGGRYRAAVVWAPTPGEFVCIEPMAGITDAVNLARKGLWDLQSVPPGGVWQESFWIRPSGF